MTELNSCTLYRTHFEYAEGLESDSDYRKFMSWVGNYALNDVCPDDDGSPVYQTFKLIRPSLDRSIRNRILASKGGTQKGVNAKRNAEMIASLNSEAIKQGNIAEQNSDAIKPTLNSHAINPSNIAPLNTKEKEKI